jgi:hypothetical protein
MNSASGSRLPQGHLQFRSIETRGKNAGLNLRASRLENARTYEDGCLHSLKAMPLDTKKDARLKLAATSAGAEIWLLHYFGDEH